MSRPAAVVETPEVPELPISGLPSSLTEDFSFLPKALVDKCKPFIVRYHELHGYSCLPDILWHPETRNFIKTNAELARLFKKSTSSRSAKKANEGFVLIATVILSVEILASGFAGWGARSHQARQRAQDLLAAHVPKSRARLIERYLYPQIDRSRDVLGALAPPDPPDHLRNIIVEPRRHVG